MIAHQTLDRGKGRGGGTPVAHTGQNPGAVRSAVNQIAHQDHAGPARVRFAAQLPDQSVQQIRPAMNVPDDADRIFRCRRDGIGGGSV